MTELTKTMRDELRRQLIDTSDMDANCQRCGATKALPWLLDSADERDRLSERVKELEAERDTLRRLLNETAVPALSNIQNEPSKHDAQSSLDRVMWARDALSTIRNGQQKSKESPSTTRCTTCDDTRVIYGHGSAFPGPCPTCQVEQEGEDHG